MAQFEYQTIEFVQKEKQGMGIRVISGTEYFPRYLNGKEIADWESKPDFNEYLQELGAEGWQYAGNGPSHHEGFSCVFFRAQ